MTSRVKLFVSNEQETAISSLRCHVFSGGPVAITFPGLPLIWPSTYFILPTHPLHIDQFISYIGSRSGGGPLRGLATGFPIGPSPKSLDSHII